MLIAVPTIVFYIVAVAIVIVAVFVVAALILLSLFLSAALRIARALQAQVRRFGRGVDFLSDLMGMYI